MKTLTLTDEQFKSVIDALDYASEDYGYRSSQEDKADLPYGPEVGDRDGETYAETLLRKSQEMASLSTDLLHPVNVPILTVDEGGDGEDWTLAEGAAHVWVTVDNLSVYIRRVINPDDSNGIEVELLPARLDGDALQPAIDTAFATQKGA